MVAAACAPQQVVSTVIVTSAPEVVVQTQVIESTSVVEVTSAATQRLSFTTPHPILGDLRVRQAIAFCTDRDELIEVSYPYLTEEDRAELLMDTNIPSVSWAHYGGDELTLYPFDPQKGAALLDEAGWTGDPDTIRTAEDGRQLRLDFRTTTAGFRVTWATVWEEQMAKCGIRIIRTHIPGSELFGDSSGLRIRDFELAAYAWVGQTDPSGQTLYSCSQIPRPENGWNGQNYMGWCNETASNAISAANNTLDREVRIEQYRTFQIEFTKDMVSLPLFQRSEGSAAVAAIEGFQPSSTEYYTWNLKDWTRTDGQDSVVLAFTQLPSSLYMNAQSAAVASTMRWLFEDSGQLNCMSQVDYDYQVRCLTEIPSLENGQIVVNAVEVAPGTEIVNAFGEPTDAEGNLLTLAEGVVVATADGEQVTYSGSDPVTMNQIVITYRFVDGLTWSDGEPVKAADFELSYTQGCDRESGLTSYLTCDSIESVEFTNDTEYTVTYKPGYFNAQSFVPPFSGAPSHEVVADGRTLAEVPAGEWQTLEETAITPMGYGPYMIESWDQDQGVLTFVVNPYYWGDEPAIKTVIVQLFESSTLAVDSLKAGTVDVVGPETLGAGEEVKRTREIGPSVQVAIEPSATWEHIDFNLFTP
jgi:ABC-type transport system substrate-binding protein